MLQDACCIFNLCAWMDYEPISPMAGHLKGSPPHLCRNKKPRLKAKLCKNDYSHKSTFMCFFVVILHLFVAALHPFVLTIIIVNHPRKSEMKSCSAVKLV